LSGKIRVIIIIASLAALAIILSPALSIPGLGPSGNSTVFSEEPINETAIAPPEISQEDFAMCNSINEDVESIIVEVDDSRANSTRKIAADLLLGEYCNRPSLVREMNGTGHTALSLVAYACDAASGKVGDTQLRDSLTDHKAIYCESAHFSINEEAAILKDSAEGFRQDFIAALREDNSTSPEFVAELEASVDQINSAADTAISLVTTGDYYEAVKKLDEASRAFEGLLKRVEESK
jgi:hypothetical protein